MAIDKKVPLGKPLPLTSKQRQQLSKVTPIDIAKVQEFWRNTAPKEFKTLLDAETVEDEENTKE